MRTKALILTAAISTVGVASSMAQVFSDNAVGYYNLNMLAGFNLVANQFNNGANDISTVLPNVLDGSSALTWNSGTQSFNDADLYFGGVGWLNSGTGEPSTTVLNPGSGFFLSTPEAIEITVVGEVPEGTLPVNIPPMFGLVSQPTPQSLALDAAGDELPAVDGDSILFWDPVIQSYAAAILYFGGIGWLDSETGDPVSPTPEVGEAFFYSNAGAGFVWERVFEVE